MRNRLKNLPKTKLRNAVQLKPARSVRSTSSQEFNISVFCRIKNAEQMIIMNDSSDPNKVRFLERIYAKTKI